MICPDVHSIKFVGFLIFCCIDIYQIVISANTYFSMIHHVNFVPAIFSAFLHPESICLMLYRLILIQMCIWNSNISSRKYKKVIWVSNDGFYLHIPCCRHSSVTCMPMLLCKAHHLKLRDTNSIISLHKQFLNYELSHRYEILLIFICDTLSFRRYPQTTIYLTCLVEISNEYITQNYYADDSSRIGLLVI